VSRALERSLHKSFKASIVSPNVGTVATDRHISVMISICFGEGGLPTTWVGRSSSRCVVVTGDNTRVSSGSKSLRFSTIALSVLRSSYQ
jgi:hypothetical protein